MYNLYIFVYNLLRIKSFDYSKRIRYIVGVNFAWVQNIRGKFVAGHRFWVSLWNESKTTESFVRYSLFADNFFLAIIHSVFLIFLK